MHGCWCGWLLPAWVGGLLAGCAAHERPAEGAAAPVITVQPPGGTADERGRRGAASCVAITMAEAALSKAGAPVEKQRAEIEGRIAKAEKAMREGGFEDAEVIVEVARLELTRGDVVTAEPSNRASTPGLRNAMRATAVAPQMPEAQLVLALAVARSVLANDPPRALGSRAAALRLVEMAAEAVLDEATGATAAVAHGLLAFVELDRGDLAGSEQRIERALEQDPASAGAWLARGELLRARKELVAAEAAYQRVLQLAPGHRGAQAGLLAAGRCEGLRLPAPGSIPDSVLGLSPLGLAPPAAEPNSCSAALLADPRADKLCRGRAALLRATTPDAYRAAADLLVVGWKALEPACEAGEPVCTAEVPTAVAYASRAYRAGGVPAKAIAAAKLLLSPRAPRVTPPELQAQLLLEMADAYFRLAMYAPARTHYEQYAARGGSGAAARAARQRARALRTALGMNHGSTDRGSAPAPIVPLAASWLAADPRWSPAAARFAEPGAER